MSYRHLVHVIIVLTNTICLSVSSARGQQAAQSVEHRTLGTEMLDVPAGKETVHGQVLRSESPIVRSYNSAADTILKTSKFLLEDAWYLISSPSRLNRRSSVQLGAFLIVLGTVYAYDQEIMDACQRNKDSPIYGSIIDAGVFFEPVGLTRKTSPFFMAGYAAGYLLKRERLQEMSLQLLEGILFEGYFRTRILWKVTGRARPRDGRGPRHFAFNKGTSFPSGHTGNMFQLATVLSHHIDHWAFTLTSYSIAAAVSLQRIDETAHWPSDVFFGAVWGTAIARAIIQLHERRKAPVSPSLSSRDGVLRLGMIHRF